MRLKMRMLTINPEFGSRVRPDDGKGDYSEYADRCAHLLSAEMAKHVHLGSNLEGVGAAPPGNDVAAPRSEDAEKFNVSSRNFEAVLSTYPLIARLRIVVDLADRVARIVEFQRMIHDNMGKQMSDEQKRFILQQQLKNIKKELGVDGGSEKDALVAKYEAKVVDILGSDFETHDYVAEEKARLGTDVGVDSEQIQSLMSAETKAAMRDEIVKLKMLEKHSPDFNVTRNYLEWLTSLPYGKLSEESFDIERAAKVLDEDHYGMKDAKDRILEFIAVGKLRGSVQGKIICFVGPPGVGKTSIGKSIARALGREFYRFSVGGLSDAAEIKGHRRTYVGAMPGKVVQGLKMTAVSNPLVLIDEIDKLGKGYQGDPASALLELLDPAQNGAFTDHYLDVPIDLSKVLFVCTANSLDTIPGPLLDRLEVLELSGYDYPEKIAITKRYLEPRARRESGLEDAPEPAASEGCREDDEEEEEDDDADAEVEAGHQKRFSVEITEDAVESIARWYAREAGVRTLQQYVERVYRKIALEAVESDGVTDFRITTDNLEKYAGKPKYTKDRMYEDTPLERCWDLRGMAWEGRRCTSRRQLFRGRRRRAALQAPRCLPSM